MNLINKLQILLAAMAITATVSAQQDPNYTFYRYNMNIYNPAFAGSSEAAEFSLGIRSQWAGIEGAPESQSAIFGMPVGKNVGLGASILNDRTFIEQQTWVAIDISYFIQLNDDHRLYFGIKGSANSYDANTDGLHGPQFGRPAGAPWRGHSPRRGANSPRTNPRSEAGGARILRNSAHRAAQGVRRRWRRRGHRGGLHP